jgi:hypothetical protein
VLRSTVPIAAIVNEVAPTPSPGAQQSTAYNTFSAGLGTAHLALVANAAPEGWSTGLGIMNTGSTPATVTVDYFDAGTGAPVGTRQTQTLAANAFWGVYQPTGGLPAPGTRATAVVTATGSTVAVICNEQGATTFMSYSAQ